VNIRGAGMKQINVFPLVILLVIVILVMAWMGGDLS
jgi:hypothetical protein